MNQFKTSLVMGDWSSDGHGRTETVMIASNLDNQKITTAYYKGVKKIGFDLIKDVACNYEDPYIRNELYQMLVVQGFQRELDEWQTQESIDGDGIDLDLDFYLEIYFFFVLKGNSKFTVEIIHNEAINIGGYGLFGQ